MLFPGVTLHEDRRGFMLGASEALALIVKAALSFGLLRPLLVLPLRAQASLSSPCPQLTSGWLRVRGRQPRRRGFSWGMR